MWQLPKVRFENEVVTHLAGPYSSAGAVTVGCTRASSGDHDLCLLRLCLRCPPVPLCGGNISFLGRGHSRIHLSLFFTLHGRDTAPAPSSLQREKEPNSPGRWGRGRHGRTVSAKLGTVPSLSSEGIRNGPCSVRGGGGIPCTPPNPKQEGTGTVL